MIRISGIRYNEHMSNFSVTQKNLQTPVPTHLLLWPIAFLTIWAMIVPFILADLLGIFYQSVYFTIMRIPKIPRSKFVKIQRHRLAKLQWAQRFGCAYCEYANGVLAWLKALANQTETYYCAIKYKHEFPGQEYQAGFYDHRDFE